MIALTIFLRRWWPYLTALALLLAFGGCGVHWLHQHDARIRVEQQLAARDTVIRWHTDTAAVRSQERRVDSVSVTRILTAVRRDTLWRHDTVHVAGDTAVRVAIPLGTLTEHDTAFARCERLNRSCGREHAADSVVISELRGSLALARTGFAVPPPVSWRTKALWAAIGAAAGHYIR